MDISPAGPVLGIVRRRAASGYCCWRHECFDNVFGDGVDLRDREAVSQRGHLSLSLRDDPRDIGGVSAPGNTWSGAAGAVCRVTAGAHASEG